MDTHLDFPHERERERESKIVPNRNKRQANMLNPLPLIAL